MKQTILKKLLVSGAAAIGIMGLSTPAAFAWSGNSSNGGYNSSHSNYSRNKHDSNNKKSYSPCYRMSNYGSNMYPSRGNEYGMNNNRNNRNNMSNSSSVAVAFAFAAASSNSSSNSSNNNRW